MELPVKINKDTLCVNVGKPASPNNMGSNLSAPQIMRSQSVKGAIWIPANLLEIVPDQTTNVGLCPQHTADMIRIALRAPGHNVDLIDLEGLQRLGIKGDQHHLSSMGVTTGKNLISFGAAALQQPRLIYSQNKPVPQLAIAAWNLKDVTFAVGRPITQLHVLACPGAIANGGVCTFVAEMTKQLEDLGMGIMNAPYSKELPWTVSLNNKLPHWFTDTTATDCTIVVLKEKNEDEYAHIKRAGDITFGRHTLFVTGVKLRGGVGSLQQNNRPKRFNYIQLLSNLALKVNMKIQGENHLVVVQGIGSLRASTIVLGADVTHPTGATDSARPSIARVVGRIDKNFMIYPGSMRLQAGGQEEIGDMRSMVKERLVAWQTENGGVLPENMVAQPAACRTSPPPTSLIAFVSAAASTCVDGLLRDFPKSRIRRSSR
jgi:hypothetical protein